VSTDLPTPRRATVDDAAAVARLLHDFNVEFDTPSPGVDVLTERLRRLLAQDGTIAVLAGDPAVALAVVTLRSNVWFDGPVALLDELVVVPEHRGAGIGTSVLRFAMELCRHADAELMEINVDIGDVDARRFYERHGFTAIEPDTGEHALYYSQPLA